METSSTRHRTVFLPDAGWGGSSVECAVPDMEIATGVSVCVGGIGVGMAVGGTGVAVGGTGVGVSVDGTGVAVGGTGVGVDCGVAVATMTMGVGCGVAVTTMTMGVGVAAGAPHPTKSNITNVTPIIRCSNFW